MKIILSLCDYSGVWSQPYRDAGYKIIQCDLKLGHDVRLMDYISDPIHGILMAPPCTHTAGSGAQYWAAKDLDGRTLEAKAIFDACVALVAIYRPVFWVLENPVGRLRRWYGPPQYTFNPCDFGGYLEPGDSTCELVPPQDAYTKRTLLWGVFNSPQKRPVEPVRANAQGSWVQSLGGKSERTKELRSMTPRGFAKAFCMANP